MAWNENLAPDSAAYRIAASDAPLLQVVAGPGTGKTFALTRRVARLLEGGVGPEEIRVFTFTRMSARDLRKSLASLQEGESDNVKAGTLHSMCFGILSRDLVLLTTGRNPRPLQDFEVRFMYEDLKGGALVRLSEVRRMVRDFESAWARLQHEEPGWAADDDDANFERSLYDWLRFHSCMLIGEVIPEALKYLRSEPDLEDRNAINHVIVDEYQDLNKAEQEVIGELAKSSTLMIVGDEDQSIYAFKNARPEGIREFGTTHPGTSEESMSECRRCDHDIVATANSLIRHNTDRAARALDVHVQNAKGTVSVVRWDNPNAEADGIARTIQHYISTLEIEPGEIIVMAQARQIASQIHDRLLLLDIQSENSYEKSSITGNPTKIDECKLLEAITLVKITINPFDLVSLRCWVGFGSNNLRSPAWKRIRNYAKEAETTMVQALENIRLGAQTLQGSAQVKDRLQLLNTRMEECAGLTGNALVDYLFPASEPWAVAVRSTLETPPEGGWDLAQIKSKLSDSFEDSDVADQDNAIRIMSLHKAKGLTSKVAFVVGCIDGLLPRKEPGMTEAQDEAHLREQRRLFYVGITRPRNILVVSSSRKMLTSDAHNQSVTILNTKGALSEVRASRFIHEMGPVATPVLNGADFLQSLR